MEKPTKNEYDPEALTPVYTEAEQIQALQKRSKTITEIQETIGLSYSALHTYLAYTKIIYEMSEIRRMWNGSENYKLWKNVIEILTPLPTENHL